MIGTNYFQNFQKILYGDYIVTNILNRFKIKNLGVLINSKIYEPYFINDGERPETIAESYYGSTTFFWLVLIANNMKNIYEDWPKTQDILDEYIINKYGSVEYAKSVIHHYKDSEGYYIRQEDWDGSYENSISIYDYEYALNDTKRNINLIKVDYKLQIQKEFQLLFK